MTDVYKKFDAAVGALSAYAITKDGKQIGRIVFKFGNAVTCYAQVWGQAMQFGIARGGNYDRATAAWEAACAKFTNSRCDPFVTDWIKQSRTKEFDGIGWQHRLENAGYTVQHVLG